MNFKLKTWVKKMKFNAQLNSSETKKTASYFKASIISILIGIILTMILISFLGANPFEFFIKTFNVVFTRNINLQNALSWFVTYSLFGLGLAIGFKIGLFNMSGSGQAIISMGITGIMLIKLFGKQPDINSANGSIIFLILITMIFVSVLLSSITGILKVFFNIHEVATSILLNWTVWYIFKWAFMRNGWNSSTPLIPSEWIELAGLKWLFPIILMTIVFVSVWLILTYTTIGYKFKLVGTQKDAAKYIGINYKKYIISATAIQGLCIGLGSFVYWCAIKRSYSLNSDVIPTIGFDAIAIALLAFNNILGILPISLLWGTLNVGMTAAIPSFSELGREISPLVFGFVVYSSTFVSLFIRFKPIEIIKFNIYYYYFDLKTRKIVQEKNIEIKKIKEEIKKIKNNNFNTDYQNLISLYNEVLQYKNNLQKMPKEISGKFLLEKNESILLWKRKMEQLKEEIKDLKLEGYDSFKHRSYKNIKTSFSLKSKRLGWNLLNPAIKELSELEDLKIKYEAEKRKLTKHKKKSIRLISIKNEKENIKKVEEKLNLKWKEIIFDLNKNKQNLNIQKKQNLKSAKEELKLFLQNKKVLSKKEFQLLKFETLMKLGEKYGCR
ncbi:ABC transporter permease [Spiroplasma taiwanense]|uniref:Ribose/galactose ABC transporter permease n=1 Tax=Spiroplasma taiwanense CT-1 TaxID=1276220 RepID=S5LYP0_9MOLU|nr:ABC transporter permease [Spiroplasma taiwanense]AGR40782.1 ribose/galactose ABC transporter permease [Spiroplasma taiwanense CT-1]